MLLRMQPKSAQPSGALPSNFGGGLALPSMGAAPAPLPLAPKPAGKQKLAPGQLLAQQAGLHASPPPAPTEQL